jgi:hypothetical protein
MLLIFKPFINGLARTIDWLDKTIDGLDKDNSEIEQFGPSHAIASWEELYPTICSETERYQCYMSF